MTLVGRDRPVLAAALAVFVVACASAPPPAAVPLTTASTPSPASTGRALVSARATKVPPDHRFIAASDGESGRILLIDLGTGTGAQVVTARGTSGKPYFQPPFSESADGRRLLVGATGPSARSALYLVEVSTGRVALLYEDEQIWAIGPLSGVLSPDGERYALHGHGGVRVGDTSGGATTLLVEDEDPKDMGKIWFPLAWSPDRTMIVLAQGTDAVTRLGAFNAATGEMIWAGTGSHVSWRAKSPRLAVAGTAGTFSGDNRVYVVEPNDGQLRDLEPLAGKEFGSIAWHPTDDRVLYTVADNSFAESDIYTRSLGEDFPKRVNSPKKVWQAWWSSDGSRIYATTARGATTGAAGVGDLDILELPSGRVVASVCRADPRGQCR